ncbi:lipopolysaccharide biosynthesis protein, partial [Shewanella colwelliana]|uniref:lipopolysaccharide biosynthesis protein n=1 Tax=Shewanella colwelliana TaxID=23 RepID=UPI001C7DC037
MLKRLLKGGVIYALSDIFSKLSPFILLPLFVSSLSLTSFGKLEFITVLSTFFSFVIGWGSVQGLLRLYVDDKVKSVSSSFFIIVISTFVSLGIVFLWGAFSNVELVADADDIYILYLCVAFGFFYGINNIAFTILRIEERLYEYAKYNLLSSIFQICIISSLLLYFKLDFLSKMIGLVLSNFLLMFILYGKIISRVIVFSFSREYLYKTFNFFSPICGNNLLGWGKSSLDKVVVKVLLGDEALGLYSFTVQVCQMLKLGLESFLKSLNVLIYNNSNFVSVIEEKRFYIIALLQTISLGYFGLITALNSTGILGEYSIPIALFAMLMCSRVILLTS